VLQEVIDIAVILNALRASGDTRRDPDVGAQLTAPPILAGGT
jgi:hypothetical protein